MREIKFRAWDKTKATMINDILSEIDPTGFFNTEFYTPMQYTGLKDKNGVEIYEGDILAGNWIVIWHEAGFYLHIKELFNDTLYMPMSKKQESEVIGNIYENPELINE